MERNGILYGENGRKRIADNTLVALTLMIAESRTEEKDVVVKVVVTTIPLVVTVVLPILRVLVTLVTVTLVSGCAILLTLRMPVSTSVL